MSNGPFKTGLLPQWQGADRFAIGWAEEYMGEAPEPVYPIDVTQGQTINWGMLGNGPDPTLTVNGGTPVGDCFFAEYGHQIILAITLGKLPRLLRPPTGSSSFT